MIRKAIQLVLLPKRIYNSAWNRILLSYLTKNNFVDLPQINGRLVRRGKGVLNIGENLKINSDSTTNPVGLSRKMMFYIAPNTSITIGDNVGISTSLFYCNDKITIEDNVLIGGGCQLLDNDFHSLGYEDRVIKGDKNVRSAPILIKEGAFIGTQSIILKGVTVGIHSIIAAGSVVNKSIPDNEIWGGNPAKFIKTIN